MKIKKTPDWPLFFSLLRYKKILISQIQKRTSIKNGTLSSLSSGRTKMPRGESAKQLEDLAREELTVEELERVGFE